MLGNLKLALRLLAKSRGFSAVAIVTLAVTTRLIRPSSRFSLIMKQGMQQTLVVLGAGLGLFLLAGYALAAIFFQVKPYDPLSLGLSALILTGTTMLACFLPARRATRVTPLSGLRAE